MIDYKALVENLQTDRIIEMMRALGATDYQEDDKAVIFPTICHHDNENDADFGRNVLANVVSETMFKQFKYGK